MVSICRESGLGVDAKDIESCHELSQAIAEGKIKDLL